MSNLKLSHSYKCITFFMYSFHILHQLITRKMDHKPSALFKSWWSYYFTTNIHRSTVCTTTNIVVVVRLLCEFTDMWITTTHTHTRSHTHSSVMQKKVTCSLEILTHVCQKCSRFCKTVLHQNIKMRASYQNTESHSVVSFSLLEKK